MLLVSPPQVALANPDGTPIASLPVSASGYIANPSSAFNRPADVNAYASGDLVANDTAAGNVVPLSWPAARVAAGSFMVRRVRLRKSSNTITLATFRLHLYAASPVPVNGDNGALSTPQSGYLGSFDLDIAGANGRAFTNGAEVIGVPAVGTEVSVALAAGQTIYGLLEARAAYVPANSETFTVELEILQN